MSNLSSSGPETLLAGKTTDMQQIMGPMPKSILLGGSLVFFLVLIALLVGSRLIKTQQLVSVKLLSGNANRNSIQVKVQKMPVRTLKPGDQVKLIGETEQAGNLSIPGVITRVNPIAGSQASIIDLLPDNQTMALGVEIQNGNLVTGRISLWDKFWYGRNP